MHIPSYDELTPPIPDVLASESVTQLALFLGVPPSAERQHAGAQPVHRDRLGRWELGVGSCQSLYACLRGSHAGLLEIACDFSPRVMRLNADEVLLDVSGLGRLIGEPAAIARELGRAARGSENDGGRGSSLAHDEIPTDRDRSGAVRVAIAPTQIAARLLAAADGLEAASRVVTTDAAAAIAPLPIARLQPLETLPPGISVRDRQRPYETCERWGIETLGDLAALPAADLASRLGRRGTALQRLARGLDPRPFVPDPDVPRFVQRLELEWPIDALEPLSFVLARLLEPLAEALERADRGAAAIHFEARLTDRSTYTRVLQLPAPLRDARVLRTLLLLDLESHPLFRDASEGRREPPRSGGPSAQRGGGGAPPSEVMIDVVALELDPAPARITQFSLLERAIPSPEALSTLLARLSALCGESRVGAAELVDSHRPGAFAMREFSASRWPLAIGHLALPQPLPVLRRQRIPPAIRVRVERGRPVHVAAPRRGMPDGAVVDAAGPWRTSGEWWDASASGGGAPRAWDRDEWDVALTTGAICRIYRDRHTERWHLEGLYD